MGSLLKKFFSCTNKACNNNKQALGHQQMYLCCPPIQRRPPLSECLFFFRLTLRAGLARGRSPDRRSSERSSCRVCRTAVQWCVCGTLRHALPFSLSPRPRRPTLPPSASHQRLHGWLPGLAVSAAEIRFSKQENGGARGRAMDGEGGGLADSKHSMPKWCARGTEFHTVLPGDTMFME